jgi:hypothetical protein
MPVNSAILATFVASSGAYANARAETISCAPGPLDLGSD